MYQFIGFLCRCQVDHHLHNLCSPCSLVSRLYQPALQHNHWCANAIHRHVSSSRFCFFESMKPCMTSVWCDVIQTFSTGKAVFLSMSVCVVMPYTFTRCSTDICNYSVNHNNTITLYCYHFNLILSYMARLPKRVNIKTIFLLPKHWPHMIRYVYLSYRSIYTQRKCVWREGGQLVSLSYRYIYTSMHVWLNEVNPITYDHS